MTAGLVASLLAARVGIPALLLFLAVGMLVGSDGAGLVEFSDYSLARTVGVIALALILFEGGLTSGFTHIRPVLAASISLALVGTLLTAALTAVAAVLLFDLGWLEALLLGSILSSTDGAAIFALLRGSSLRRRLAGTLEGESGLNDPVAVLLVVGFIEWIELPDYGVLDMALLFVRELGIGVVAGLAVGWAAVRAARRTRLSTVGLYPVASLTTAGLAFGLAGSLHGSGFLAVYLTGLVLGESELPAARTVTAFHQGLAWVAQLVMFLTLGLLVFPSQLDEVALGGTALALALTLVARPVGAIVATAPAGYTLREQVLLGWAGLRGAVPVVLATFPVIEEVPDSLEYFNIVFFAVLVSTLVQGSTFETLARGLGLTTTEPALPRPLAEAGAIRRLGAEVLEFPVQPEDAIAGARVRDLGLPREAVVTVIVRGAKAIPPRGSTRVMEGDELHVLVREDIAAELPALIRRWRRGPLGRPPRELPLPAGRRPVLSSWRWSARDGDPARPGSVHGQPVVERLRVRWDRPGGLWALADGRYAVSGPIGAVGGRQALSSWARRRMRRADADERAWLQTVIGALAEDLRDPAARDVSARAPDG